MAEHFTVVALARARAAWLSDVSSWASSAALPMELVRCVSAEELRARLETGRPYSAVLVDASLPAFDRDLVDRARRAGCAVLAVDDGVRRRDWVALEVSGVLSEPVERGALLAMLRQHARSTSRLPGRSTTSEGIEAHGGGAGLDQPGTALGRLVAVTGQRGSGCSTTAMAIAQGMGASLAPQVLLADLHLDATQALLHHTGDVVPGVSELVEAHRSTSLGPEAVRDLTFSFDDRPYRLLAGLRRHRDWAALRPRATEAAIASVRLAFRVVVADIAPDVEGEDECGSLDVEERNHLARCVAAQAGVVVLTARASAVGVSSLVRIVDDIARLGVEPRRMLPVIVGAPRPGLARMELSRDLAALAGGGAAAVAANGPSAIERPANPVFLAARRDLDRLIAGADPLPSSYCEPIAAAVLGLLDRLGDPSAPQGVTIRPGSLASWPE